jgi:hypothetical protein
MTGIFISYRREDSGPYAGRLHDALVTHFGSDSVFFDIDTISPGEDFREVIQRTCSTCKVLLAIIGREWVTAQDKQGRLRLENKNDTLRVEIASALKNGLRVIPVLVGGAEMPDESALPEDLQALAYRNAWEVSDKRFHQDVKSLVDVLKRTLESVPQGAPASVAPKSGRAPQKTSGVARKAPEPKKKVSRSTRSLEPVTSPQKSESLFPIYGIVLGKTSTSEIAKIGHRTKTINEKTGKPYACYEVKGADFWYDETSKIVNSIFLTNGDSLPEPWQELGLRWEASYVEWFSLLKGMGYSIEVTLKPHIGGYDGHASFTAGFIARKTGPHAHKIEMDFSMSRGTKTSSPETLFSMDVGFLEDEDSPLIGIDDEEEVVDEPALDDEEIEEYDSLIDDDESSSLFPIYGIVLGETSTSEIAKIGHRTKTIDKNTGKPYYCYEVNGIDFWYNETSKIVTSMRLTTSLHPMPEPWQELGFRYQNSYDRWLSLLKGMGYSIEVEEEPRIEQWDGHASFSAKVVARKKGLYPHEIELDFSYSRGTTTSSSNTLYGMGIRVTD